MDKLYDWLDRGNNCVKAIIFLWSILIVGLVVSLYCAYGG